MKHESYISLTDGEGKLKANNVPKCNYFGQEEK